MLKGILIARNGRSASVFPLDSTNSFLDSGLRKGLLVEKGHHQQFWGFGDKRYFVGMLLLSIVFGWRDII